MSTCTHMDTIQILICIFLWDAYFIHIFVHIHTYWLVSDLSDDKCLIADLHDIISNGWLVIYCKHIIHISNIPSSTSIYAYIYTYAYTPCDIGPLLFWTLHTNCPTSWNITRCINHIFEGIPKFETPIRATIARILDQEDDNNKQPQDRAQDRS